MSEHVATRPVEIGLSLSNRSVLFGLPVEVLIECAEIADRSEAIGSVWVGDNLLSKPRLEAVVLLSALAVRTRRVRLGTVCLASFPLRQPLVFALQWASLDVLSGGRTHLVVCSGGPASYGPRFAAELAATGVRSNERVGRVEEGIAVLRRLWTEPEVHHAGRFYQLPGVALEPKPVQAHVPIDIAVNPPPGTAPDVVERALRRVARLGDGWQSSGTSPAAFRERWSRIQAYAREYGRADAVRTSSMHLMVNIDDDPDRAWRGAYDAVSRYYGYGPEESLAPADREKLRHWIVSGPPERVAAKIQAFVDAGCTAPILRFCAPDPRAQLERCIREVLPRIRREAPILPLA